MGKRIFITGSSGLVGRALARRVAERGDKAVCLTRNKAKATRSLPDGAEVVEGDPMQAGPWMRSLDGCDAVVHLAGESLFGTRWSPAQKRLLRESRVLSTQLVGRAIGEAAKRPATLVNASAIGYYGDVPEGDLTEVSPRGDDFLADVCAAWEQAASEIERHGTRVVRARIGVVLAREGGALETMLPPFKLGAGGPVASGKQWFSWIHRDDVVSALLAAIDRSEITGPMNVTAPTPVRNAEFARALGAALHRPAFLPMPAFALRIIMGEASYVVATGQKVLPALLTQGGFEFRYPTCETALKAILAT